MYFGYTLQDEGGTSMGRNKFTRNIGVLSLYMAVQSIGKGKNAQKHSCDPWCYLP